MDRQQLDRGDAELAQMRDHAGLGQAAIRAARFRGDVFAPLRQAFDMGLVDDRVFPRHLRPALVRPGMGGIDDDRFVHVARIVAPVERQIGCLRAGAIAEMRIAPGELPAELLAVGVDQQLVGIEPMAGLGRVGAMHAIAVELAGRDVREIGVPDVVGALRQRRRARLRAGLRGRTGTVRPWSRWPKTTRSWCRVRPRSRRADSGAPAETCRR